jgi:periplasmic copper chaperone A
MRTRTERSALMMLAALSLGAACCLATPTFARDCKPKITQGWVRLPPGKMPMMAGFGRIANACTTPVMIVGARSPSFASVELHETRIVDGISRMRHLPQLRLAPDASAVLKPGGMHLMLMKPSAALKPGSKVVIEFELAGGGALLGEFEVRKPEI